MMVMMMMMMMMMMKLLMMGDDDDDDQVVKEELPPIRLDVRKRIAKEQLALKLSRKTTVITHATSMSNDQQGSNSTRSITGLDTLDEDGMLKLSDAGMDDYDDEHASVISNESEELEKLKSSPDINKEEDLLNELGYIGHISEGDDDDDDDDEEGGSDDGSSTIGFSVQGGASMKPKNQYSSTLEVHKEFIGHANRRDTLRQIKSVGSVRALVAREQSQRAQSEDIVIPSSSKRSSSIPDNSSSKTKNHTSDSLRNTFMFISKLTEEGLPHINQLLMSGIDSALNRDTSTTAQQQEESLAHSSPVDRSSSSSSNSIEGYNASPVGIKYKGSGRSTFAFTSETIASAKRDTQLVSPLLSASTVTSLMNSASTRGSILNSHKSSSPSTIVRIAPTTTVHLDSITDLGNSSSGSSSHKESKFYVPALQSIHNQDKPVLQKLDKIFHRMTFQAADPKPDLVITPKPPLTLETLFPDQIMRKGDATNDDDDDEMEAYLQRSLESSPSTNKGNANHRGTGTAALIDRLDRVLDQHGDLAMVTRNNSYGTLKAPSTSPQQSKFKAVKDDDNDQDFYKIDVHRLQLPDINAPMVCLYTPSSSSPQVQTKGSSSFFKGDALKKNDEEEEGHSSRVSSTAVGASPSNAFDSPLLYSKHSNSFYKTSSRGSPVDATKGGTGGARGGGGLSKDNTHSSSAVSLPLEGILDHNYKQGLNEDTLTYMASMQIAQASHGDAAFHSLPVVSDLDMMFSIDDLPTDTSSLHTSLPRTHQMKARSVTHETSDSGIYDIDVEEHRKLIPSTVADLSEDGYIYQHSTNSYVRRGVENRSKFGQYQRGEYTPSPIQQQTPMEFIAPWSEHMDTKGELPVQIFSERHLEEIEQSTAGFGSPVIYIPKEPPALEPLLPLNNDPIISSSSSRSPMKGSIASISTLGPPPYSLATATNQHGITQIPGGTALGSSSYAPVRAVMQYPIDSPLNYVHYHPTTTTTTATTTYVRTANDNGSVDDTDRSSTYSPVDYSTVRSPTRLKEIPSSKAVSSLKSEINDYINRLDASSSSSAVSYRSMSTSITGLGVDGDDEVSESDLAKAKLWSRLNSRYSGDRDGEHTAKLKVKQYIYEGIKESTHIENQYMKDMDAWF
jgi:hypothetical protein